MKCVTVAGTAAKVVAAAGNRLSVLFNRKRFFLVVAQTAASVVVCCKRFFDLRSFCADAVYCSLSACDNRSNGSKQRFTSGFG